MHTAPIRFLPARSVVRPLACCTHAPVFQINRKNPVQRLSASVRITKKEHRTKQVHMTSKPQMDADIRDLILSDPEAVLEDKDLMSALVAANESTMGEPCRHQPNPPRCAAYDGCHPV